jgi:hypothetical protein
MTSWYAGSDGNGRVDVLQPDEHDLEPETESIHGGLDVALQPRGDFDSVGRHEAEVRCASW